MNPGTPAIASERWVFPVSMRRLSLVEDGVGNLRADAIPTDEELSEFYARHFERGGYRRRGKSWQGWHRARRVAPLLVGRGAVRILDYGCGNGQFLRACRRRFQGAELAGFEMSPEQCEVVRSEHGVTADHNWERLTELNPGGFDLVTAWHVLEHAPDPVALVRRLVGALRPGGRCVLAVPNRDAWGMRLRGAEWAWCQPPYVHLWLFSPAGLESVIARAIPGARVKVITRDAWDGSWLVDGLVAQARLLEGFRSDRLRLRIESAARLAAAALQEAVLNPLVLRWNGRGSELVATIAAPGG